MKLTRNLDELNNENSLFCLIIGNFDGVHNGHTAIIKKILEENKKDDLKLIIVTFIPHPEKIINKRKNFLINSYEERQTLLEKHKVDYLVELNFNKNLQKMAAKDFFSKFLSNIKNLKKIYVGYDFRIGLNKSGDIKDLKKFFLKKNILINQLPQIKENENISSSKIREHINKGYIDKVNNLLGRSFFIKGKVVKGDKRGRELGFPTANLKYDYDRIIPCTGVYYTKTLVRKREYNSITNISNNPTFNGKKISVESFIIDFNQNIYDEDISLYFLKRHRDIIKFNDISTLKAQILDDVKKAKKFFLS